MARAFPLYSNILRTRHTPNIAQNMVIQYSYSKVAMIGVSLAFYFVCSLIPFGISPLVQTIARIEFYAPRKRKRGGHVVGPLELYYGT